MFTGMRDITYCAFIDCPSRECRIKVLNNKFQPGEIISMADFSKECRFYVGYWLGKGESGDSDV